MNSSERGAGRERRDAFSATTTNTFSPGSTPRSWCTATPRSPAWSSRSTPRATSTISSFTVTAAAPSTTKSSSRPSPGVL